MSDQPYTRLRLRHGAFVRVLNEDVPAVEDDQKKTDEEVENSADPADLQAALARIDEINAAIEPLEKEREELKGQLQALQEQIAQVTSPEAVEAVANEMTEEREVANRVMNAAGITMTDTQKKLRGHPLRVEVINATRVKNGRTVLTDEQAKNEPFVKGLYAGIADAAGATGKQVDADPLRQQQLQVQNQGAAFVDPRAAHTQRLYAPAEKKA